MIQFADITGIYGVSFLIVMVNGAFADIFLIKKRTKDMPLFPLSYTAIGFAILLLFIISVVVYGQIKLHEQRPGNLFRASVIQGNISQDMKWETPYQSSVLEIYKDLSLKAASSSPSFIVWPETAVPFLFHTDKDRTEELVDFQTQSNAYLLFGSVLLKGKKDKRYLLSNSAVLLDAHGQEAYRYDKIHLVPFGEYVPLQTVLFFINRLVAGIGDYVPGEQYIRAETPFGEFATVICYEIIFPGLVRKFFSNGGDFLVTITNDAWFGKTTGPYQHFSMAVFRAVENRKPVIRAANTGISGYIDSNGKIISRTELFQRGILTEDLKTDRTRSFYSRYGDLFMYVCIIFSVILLAHLFGKARIM
jgi:apolipoprotein N-acyltransferase